MQHVIQKVGNIFLGYCRMHGPCLHDYNNTYCFCFFAIQLKMLFSSKICLKTDDIFVPIRVLSRLCAMCQTVKKNLWICEKIKIFYFLFLWSTGLPAKNETVKTTWKHDDSKVTLPWILSFYKFNKWVSKDLKKFTVAENHEFKETDTVVFQVL